MDKVKELSKWLRYCATAYEQEKAGELQDNPFDLEQGLLTAMDLFCNIEQAQKEKDCGKTNEIMSKMW